MEILFPDLTTFNLFTILETIYLINANEKVMFKTKTHFSGGCKIYPKGSDNHIYRFSVKKDKLNRLHIEAEKRNPETGMWRKVAGWFLESIWGTEGIYVDFGKGWYIRPTPEIWSEIEHKLNDKEATWRILQTEVGD